jgi:hypothetical protein
MSSGAFIVPRVKSQSPEHLGCRQRQIWIDRLGLPAVAEPWSFAFNAKVSFRPVMTPEDLGAAMPSISKAVEQYGK